MTGSATGRVLTETTIPGLNIADALARMGDNPKLYMRIIHSFVTNMPGNLEGLATNTITAETLADYAIKIHGAKGSCYGIGADAVGDAARDLEMAAKKGDLETCLCTNDAFIAATLELIKKLECLEAEVEAAEGTIKAQEQKPDALKLAALLVATQRFDIDQMNNLVEELTGIQYAHDGQVIDTIKKSFDAFDYQTIEETIVAYL